MDGQEDRLDEEVVSKATDTDATDGLGFPRKGKVEVCGMQRPGPLWGIMMHGFAVFEGGLRLRLSVKW